MEEENGRADRSMNFLSLVDSGWEVRLVGYGDPETVYNKALNTGEIVTVTHNSSSVHCFVKGEGGYDYVSLSYRPSDGSRHRREVYLTCSEAKGEATHFRCPLVHCWPDAYVEFWAPEK